MRAVVYQGNGQKDLLEIAAPHLQASTDAIVRMRSTTICGTDLHILRGDVSSCTPGRILGHEGAGIVESVGSAVALFKPGDRVMISCITACGRCDACRKAMHSHCADGGWLLGNRIDGTQAEFVRVPHADMGLYAIPTGSDDDLMVLLSDILPTGFECGVLNGKLRPGSTVAIVGAGPIGLASLITAKMYSPSAIFMIDVDQHRLTVAKALGATAAIHSSTTDPVDAVMKLTGDVGVDTAIEAVGIPATFQLCAELVAAGGTIANIGVHGAKVDLHLERLWSHNITITTGLVDTYSTRLLLRSIQAGTLSPGRLITHRFPFAHILEAYDTFEYAATTQALKVLIRIDE